jgi:protein-disulfide isomerase
MTWLPVPVSQRDHIAGTPWAEVVMIEYGDYQCPYCGMAYPIVKQLQQVFGESLAFVFRNFPPTSVHPYAERAAETAEWAALNQLFWPMHDFLYEHQRSLDPASLLDAVAQLGLNGRELEAGWRDRALQRRVAEDVESGDASGVTGTPTFFINGVRHEGPWDFDSLAAVIRAAGGHIGRQS